MANLSSYLPGGIDPSAVTITGGTINATAIGASTAAAGTFTTFTSTGIDDNATSTAITIDSSQNVGIGTNASSSTPTLTIQETASGTNHAVQQQVTSAGVFNQNLTWTNGLSSRAFTWSDLNGELMRIDSSGNVGIGTSNPSAPLQVTNTTPSGTAVFQHSGGNSYGTILTLETTGGTDDPVLSFKNYNGGSPVYYGIAGTDDGSLAFKSGASISGFGTERMRIDSSGNVGIGTDNPSGLLDVYKAGNTSYLNIETNNPASAAVLSLIAGSGSAEAIGYAQALRFGTITGANAAGFNERMRIDSSGNVGIGTSSPSGALEISTSNYGLVFSPSFTSTVGTITFTNGGNRTSTIKSVDFGASLVLSADTQQGNSSTNIIFETDASERMRIDSSGNVGIGTSSPVTLLHVNGDARIVGAYTSTTGFSANVFVQSTGKLFRSTSSLRYKHSIEDATHGLSELLTLRPVTYKGNEDGDSVFGGLIAEEVHDAGLTEFVQYDEEGRPDALAYGNMVSICIKAIQEQQEMIETLQAEVAALKGA